MTQPEDHTIKKRVEKLLGGNVKHPRQQRTPIGFAVRSVVLQQLRCIHQGQRLNVVLMEVDSQNFSRADAALARNILLHALRFHYAAEAAFAPFCSRSPGQLDRLILIIGTVSLIWLNMPSHVVLSTTVALAPKKSRGFVHAVLQRLIEQWPANRDDAEKQDKRNLLLKHNAPSWLLQRWRKHWPEDVSDILHGQALIPALDLCCKTADLAQCYARQWGATYLGGHSLRHHGNPAALDGFAKGDWWAQDWAAQWPVWLARRVLSGARVLDMCAAPGGKTAQMLSFGAQVTALDQNEKRLARLQDNMQRLGYAPKLVHTRAEDWQPDQPFAVIFLDAPCSASGTIRRHPDILLRDHDPQLHQQQSILLEKAVECLMPGGLLVYSVCSINPGEGWGLLEKKYSGLGLIPAPLDPADMMHTRALIRPHRHAAHQIQTLPGDALSLGGMDGFYMGFFRNKK